MCLLHRDRRDSFSLSDPLLTYHPLLPLPPPPPPTTASLPAPHLLPLYLPLPTHALPAALRITFLFSHPTFTYSHAFFPAPPLALPAHTCTHTALWCIYHHRPGPGVTPLSFDDQDGLCGLFTVVRNLSSLIGTSGSLIASLGSGIADRFRDIRQLRRTGGTRS